MEATQLMEELTVTLEWKEQQQQKIWFYWTAFSCSQDYCTYLATDGYIWTGFRAPRTWAGGNSLVYSLVVDGTFSFVSPAPNPPPTHTIFFFFFSSSPSFPFRYFFLPSSVVLVAGFWFAYLKRKKKPTPPSSYCDLYINPFTTSSNFFVLFFILS